MAFMVTALQVQYSFTRVSTTPEALYSFLVLTFRLGNTKEYNPYTKCCDSHRSFAPDLCCGKIIEQ